jgi:hypothetical protein
VVLTEGEMMAAKFETIQIPIVPLKNIEHFMDAWTESFCIYRGIMVFFDEDKDTRVLQFIDDLPDGVQKKLFAIGERKAGLNMVWKGRVPHKYREGEEFECCGDLFHIVEAFEYSPTDSCQRVVPAPFVAIDEKVCVVRGDAYMIRNWLARVGFTFDKEAKAWTQLVAIDRMGRGYFQWKYGGVTRVWDLSDFIEACPNWDPDRKLTVSFE